MIWFGFLLSIDGIRPWFLLKIWGQHWKNNRSPQKILEILRTYRLIVEVLVFNKIMERMHQGGWSAAECNPLNAVALLLILYLLAATTHN